MLAALFITLWLATVQEEMMSRHIPHTEPTSMERSLELARYMLNLVLEALLGLLTMDRNTR